MVEELLEIFDLEAYGGGSSKKKKKKKKHWWSRKKEENAKKKKAWQDVGKRNREKQNKKTNEYNQNLAVAEKKRRGKMINLNFFKKIKFEILIIVLISIFTSMFKLSLKELVKSIFFYPVFSIIALPTSFFNTINLFDYNIEFINVKYGVIYWTFLIGLIILISKFKKKILKILVFIILILSHVEIFYIISLIMYF